MNHKMRNQLKMRTPSGLSRRTSAASLIALLGFFACTTVLANPLLDSWQHYSQVWNGGKATYSLDLDNDSLLFQDKDGLYTSGTQIRVTSMQQTDKSIARAAGWRLGQLVWTASDIKIPPEQLAAPEHPYAAWLYTGWFAQTHTQDGGYTQSGIDIGCLGPCAGGKPIQDGLHRLLHQRLPQGWSKQVKNEMGLQLDWAWSPRRFALGSNADWAPNVQARLGNIFTDATLGSVLRIGSLNALPQQATNHLFLRTEVRAVGYNASLQGGYFSNGNVHTVKPRRAVGEVELGWLWQSAPGGQGGQYAAQIGFVRRGNEIKGLSNALGAQNFARLQFSYTP